MSIIIVSRVGRAVAAGHRPVKVDRSSPLGNPFWMSSEEKRDEVCDRFEEYFKAEVGNPNSKVRKEVIRLYKLAKSGESLALQCHCAPRRCHANTIKSYLEKYLPEK